MKRKAVLFVLCILCMVSICLADSPLYKDSGASVEDRIESLLSQMTLEDKMAMLAGDKTGFDSKPNERLGIPVLRMTDGPVGVRWGKSVAFPVSVCMAATWNPDLIYRLGQALGRETKAKGRNVLLAPCVNIHRVPHAGRNFESFGEDPFLAGSIAVPYIKGLQSEHVIATVKHFACNNQEFERSSIDAKIDTRTLHEIYLPAFRAAVQEGGVWAVMSAYNRLNGQYCSSNTWLLTDILKKRWGFQGFVMSDWGAVHSVVPTLYAGLDIEMPRDRYFAPDRVKQALRERRMKESKIDDKVRRMLRALFHMGYFDGGPDEGACDTREHREIAREVAREGIVLLKNDDVLPIGEEIHSIAVIGPHAALVRHGGGGSSRVNPIHTTSPLESIRSKTGTHMAVHYGAGFYSETDFKPVPSKYLRPPAGNEGEGLLGTYYANAYLEGEPAFRRMDQTIDFKWKRQGPEDLQADLFSVVWEGQLMVPETGVYALATGSDDGTRLYLEGELLVDNWGQHAVSYRYGSVELEEGKPVDIRIEYNELFGDAEMHLAWQRLEENPMEDALQAARTADMAIVFVGNNMADETEGKDRETLGLQPEHLRIVNAVAAINPKTVVVLNSGAAMDIKDWVDKVSGVVLAWFPGQEGGDAIADILFGHVNPSGKLVTTFFKDWEDCPAFGNYPGGDDVVEYAEGIFVGYRHFDARHIDPLFPFGFGLSYTDFEYSRLKIQPSSVKAGDSLTVLLTLKNTGDRDGAEVVQLYLGDEKASVPRPVKELKGFKKVFLKAGEEKKVTMILQSRDMAFFDIGTDDWKTEPGKFLVYIGSSSRDIRLTGAFELK